MTDILNLQVKDETLNNIISNNPYYIDIKGSVNICLIRCGQDIEKCNSIEFSTMTNYGKVLVLNPNSSKIGMCNIKLAFDNTNDNINNSGDSNYKFEKAFVTVPSLHKLNGQIYDMETFLVFSSIQKNGDILYVCLCTFSTAVNIVQSNDWKLLNFKLMNELFSKKNIVPEMYGTNDINGVPNPVDLSNFIPKEGSRNFYDYTHPLNTKVNFRVYQTPLSVSNDVLDILKTKLTPGNMYQNFKSALTKTINPKEGLYFYFSEDLTDRYKSFESNESNKDDLPKKDTFENIGESILEEQIAFEKENKFKKIKTSDDQSKQELDNFNETEIDETEKNKEKFEVDTGNNNNMSVVLTIFIISFLLLVNIGYLYFINNIFTPSDELTEENLKDCLHEIASIEMSSALKWKFNFYNTIVVHCIFTFILIILLVSFLSGGNTNSSIYKGIAVFIAMIFILGICTIAFFHLYFYNRLKNIMDDNFSQKESYFIKYIREKVLESKNIGEYFANFSRLSFSNDYTPFIGLKGMTGGYKMVPGLNNEDEENLRKEAENKGKIENVRSFYQFFSPDIIGIIKEKVLENKGWIKNILLFILFLIAIFIFGIVFQIRLMVLSDSTPIKAGLIFTIFVFCQLPYILSLVYEAPILLYSGPKFNLTTKGILIILALLALTAIILCIFIPFYGTNHSGNYAISNGALKNNTPSLGTNYSGNFDWKNNVPLWLFISIILLMTLIIGIIYFLRKIFGTSIFDYFKTKIVAGADEKTYSQENVNKISGEYEKYRDKYQSSEEKRLLLQSELNSLRTSGVPGPLPIIHSSSETNISNNKINLLMEQLKKEKEYKLNLLSEIDRLSKDEKNNARVKELEEELNKYIEAIEKYEDYIEKLEEEFKQKENKLYEKILVLKNDGQHKNELIRYLPQSLTDSVGKIDKLINFFTLLMMQKNVEYLTYLKNIIINIIEASKLMDEKEYKAQILNLIEKTKSTNIDEIEKLFKTEIKPIYGKIKNISGREIYSYLNDILRQIKETAEELIKGDFKTYDFSKYIPSIPLSDEKDKKIKVLEEKIKELSESKIIYNDYLRMKDSQEKLITDSKFEKISNNPSVSQNNKDVEIQELKRQLQNKERNTDSLRSIIDKYKENQIIYKDTIEDYKKSMEELKENFASKKDSLHQKILLLKDDVEKKTELMRYLPQSLTESVDKINKLINIFNVLMMNKSVEYLSKLKSIIINIIESSKLMDEKEYKAEIIRLVEKTDSTNIDEIERLFKNEIKPIYDKIDGINGREIYSYLNDILIQIRDTAKVLLEGDFKNYDISKYMPSIPRDEKDTKIRELEERIKVLTKSKETTSESNKRIGELETKIEELSKSKDIFDEYLRLKNIIEKYILDHKSGSINKAGLENIKNKLSNLEAIDKTKKLETEVIRLKNLLEELYKNKKINKDIKDIFNVNIDEYIRLRNLLEECISKSKLGQYDLDKLILIKDKIDNLLIKNNEDNFKEEIIRLKDIINLLIESKINIDQELKNKNNEILKLRKEKDEYQSIINEYLRLKQIISHNKEKLDKPQLRDISDKLSLLISKTGEGELYDEILRLKDKIESLYSRNINHDLNDEKSSKVDLEEYLRLKNIVEDCIYKARLGLYDSSMRDSIKEEIDKIIQKRKTNEYLTEIVKLKQIIEELKNTKRSDEEKSRQIYSLDSEEYLRLKNLVEDCVYKAKLGVYDQSFGDTVKDEIDKILQRREKNEYLTEIIQLKQIIDDLRNTKRSEKENSKQPYSLDLEEYLRLKDLVEDCIYKLKLGLYDQPILKVLKEEVNKILIKGNNKYLDDIRKLKSIIEELQLKMLR